MISATDKPFCASISLLSSTKLQPICCASILPSVDLPAPRKPIKAMPAKEVWRSAAVPLWPAKISLARAILFGVALRRGAPDARPARRGRGSGDEIFQIRPHRVRPPPQQHARDVALAAFELRNIAL